MKKYWSESEMNYIKENIGQMSIKDMAEKFGVSYQKMNGKVHKMGLNRKEASGELWTKEEDLLLKKHYEYAPKNYLMDLFPNRSWEGISQRGLLTLKMNRKTQDRYSINYNFFEEWNHDTAYVFGFISADGHLFYKKGINKVNGLQIELADYDRDILEKIKMVMEFEGPINESKRHTVKLQINNTKIIEDLISKGIPTKDKTYMIEYPSSLPDEFANDYIRGLFDGDGSLYKHGAVPRFELLGTESLIKKVASKLPIRGEEYKVQDRNRWGCNVYAIQIGGINAVKIFKWMYEGNGICLNRKKDKLKNIVINLIDNFKSKV